MNPLQQGTEVAGNAELALLQSALRRGGRGMNGGTPVNVWAVLAKR